MNRYVCFGLALLVLPACYPAPQCGSQSHARSDVQNIVDAVVILGEVANAIIVASNPPPPPRAPRPDVPPLYPFDRDAAIAALQQVKYLDCGTGGLADLSVTFKPDGAVRRGAGRRGTARRSHRGVRDRALLQGARRAVPRRPAHATHSHSLVESGGDVGSLPIQDGSTGWRRVHRSPIFGTTIEGFAATLLFGEDFVLGGGLCDHQREAMRDALAARPASRRATPQSRPTADAPTPSSITNEGAEGGG